MARAFAWAVDHKVPGTPTVYAGHPAIGFRPLGDSDRLTDFMEVLRRSLSDARSSLRGGAAGSNGASGAQ